MAFISNQWLLGAAHRDRAHQPVEARLTLDHTGDKWSRDNHVVAAFRLTREDGRHEVACLTQEDVDFLASALAPLVSTREKAGVASAVMSGLVPSALFQMLSHHFAARGDAGRE